jgi:hypothetical protein
MDLVYVETQTPEICMKAVKENGMALQFVDDAFLSAELIAMALDNNPKAAMFLKAAPLKTEPTMYFEPEFKDEDRIRPYSGGAVPVGVPEKKYDSCVTAVIATIKKRADVGKAKYGTTLDRTDLNMIDWINHAQEELMDGMLYLEKLKQLNRREADKVGTNTEAGTRAGRGTN